MIEQVRLATIVVEGKPDLRAVGRDDVLTRPRKEPHERAELGDERERVEHERDQETGRLPDEGREALEHAADAVEEEHQREDPEQDQQPSLVVLEHIRGRGHEASSGQFTPTTWSFDTRSTKPTMKSFPVSSLPVTV